MKASSSRVLGCQRKVVARKISHSRYLKSSDLTKDLAWGPQHLVLHDTQIKDCHSSGESCCNYFPPLILNDANIDATAPTRPENWKDQP